MLAKINLSVLFVIVVIAILGGVDAGKKCQNSNTAAQSASSAGASDSIGSSSGGTTGSSAPAAQQAVSTQQAAPSKTRSQSGSTAASTSSAGSASATGTSSTTGNMVTVSGSSGLTFSKVANMPPAFKGPVPSGEQAIGSFYNTNKSGDDTNGRGWCEFQYNDQMPGFAPSVSAMAGRQQDYCGLEALVTDPKTGKKMLMYIVDGFVDQWLRTPRSIDIIYGAYAAIDTDPHGDKNQVIKGVQWELTGRRANEYVYKSSKFQN